MQPTVALNLVSSHLHHPPQYQVDAPVLLDLFAGEGETLLFQLCPGHVIDVALRHLLQETFLPGAQPAGHHCIRITSLAKTNIPPANLYIHVGRGGQGNGAAR